MLTCLPQSLCSWDYRILGARAGASAITFNMMSQQGTLQHGGDLYQIVKPTILVGRWTLESGGSVIGTAEKSLMIRHYAVDTGGTPFSVQARLMSSTFNIVVGARNVGEVRKMHPFTRRAVVDCSNAVDELGQLFAFWLCALAWRNAARSD